MVDNKEFRNKFGKPTLKVEFRKKRPRIGGGPYNPNPQSSETHTAILRKKQEAIKKAGEEVVKSADTRAKEDLEAKRKRASFFGDRQLMNAIAAQVRKTKPKPMLKPQAKSPSRPLVNVPQFRPLPSQQVTRKQQKRVAPKFIPTKTTYKKTSQVENMPIGRTLIGRIDSEEDVNISRERFRSIAAFRRSQQKQRGLPVDTVVREILIFDEIPVIALAHSMAISIELLLNKLQEFGSKLKKNDTLDLETAAIIVEEFGHKYKKRVEILDKIKRDAGTETDYALRAPIVAVVGHVDHGKTSLLDALRSTNVVAKEVGGITQGIGASQVFADDGRFITFVDTPGHEIFSEMRSRGVDLTDIALLIIAADEGIQEQTIESIQHIQASKASMIVVFTKMDKPGANTEKIKQMLMRYSIVVQSLSGDVPDIEISSRTGAGLKELIKLILDQAELLDLKGNPHPKASGAILEGLMDKHRGALGTVIITNGTLKKGDPFLAGASYGKVRAITNWLGEPLDSAGPGVPVQVMGFEEVPSAGDDFLVIEESSAKEAAAKRKDIKNVSNFALSKAEMVYSIMDIWNQMSGNQSKELSFIVKADSYGSCEAISNAITKLSYPNLVTDIKFKGIGAVTDADLDKAKTSNSMIIAFKVDIKPNIIKNATEWKIKVKRYDIIYQILDDIKVSIDESLAPKEEEVMIGEAEIRVIYEKPKIGKIAGCFVRDGLIKKSAKSVLMRGGIQIYGSTIESIRQLRDDKHEVKAGQECGIIMSKFADYKVGDMIQCFESRKINA